MAKAKPSKRTAERLIQLEIRTFKLEKAMSRAQVDIEALTRLCILHLPIKSVQEGVK